MESPVRHIGDQFVEKLIVPRFMNYVRYWTESDRHATETPSSPGQWDLAKVLRDELISLGIKDVSLTSHCYVIARLPPSPGKENAPCIGFLAHIDTASDVTGRDVQPQLVSNYDGEKIELAGGGANVGGVDGGGTSGGDSMSGGNIHGLALDPAQEPDLAAHQGRAIIHGDGSTLLGADDKAGVAEIMAAVEYIAAWSPASGLPEIKHGPVEIIFSPDEETGKGLPDFPLCDIKSAVCYTLDGGPIGEIEAECFNAWKADVEFKGKVIHVGAARGLLANAVLMAASFAALLPRSESPEATDGYYGYYCPTEIKGDLENAEIEILLRDFDSDGMKRRLAALEAFAQTVEAQFPSGRVIVNAKPQYYNMKEKIDGKPEALDRLKTALDNMGIEWRLKPIRGGTDGSRLTELGIPTPNIFTGGRNFHSRLEWVSVSEMCAACKTVIELIRLWGE